MAKAGTGIGGRAEGYGSDPFPRFAKHRRNISTLCVFIVLCFLNQSWHYLRNMVAVLDLFAKLVAIRCQVSPVLTEGRAC